MDKIVLLYVVLFLFVFLLFPKRKPFRINFTVGNKNVFVSTKDYILTPLLIIIVAMRFTDSVYIFWGIIAIPWTAKLIGLFFLAAGLWLKIWSYKSLGKNWSAKINIYNDHFLVKTGPYKWIRHPVYDSYLLTFIGGFLISGDCLVLIIGVGYFFLNVARAYEEEKLLGDKFKKEYQSYHNKTGMFLPAFLFW